MRWRDVIEKLLAVIRASWIACFCHSLSSRINYNKCEFGKINDLNNRMFHEFEFWFWREFWGRNIRLHKFGKEKKIDVHLDFLAYFFPYLHYQSNRRLVQKTLTMNGPTKSREPYAPFVKFNVAYQRIFKILLYSIFFS